jgi:hypothetical protein
MSATLIESAKRHESGSFSAECTTGKVKAEFWFFSTGGVQIVCKNAANRTWRGMGKRYETEAAALDGYKSPEMKANIRAAFEAFAPSVPANVIPGNFNA